MLSSSDVNPYCWDVLNTEVSSFQGVGIEEFHYILITGGWNRGVPLYTEVSSFQGVGIEGFHCIQRCGVKIEGVLLLHNIHFHSS